MHSHITSMSFNSQESVLVTCDISCKKEHWSCMSKESPTSHEMATGTIALTSDRPHPCYQPYLLQPSSTGLGNRHPLLIRHPRFSISSLKMLQEPEGQPDESVDVLFHDAGAMDDPTLAEYNTEEIL